MAPLHPPPWHKPIVLINLNEKIGSTRFGVMTSIFQRLIYNFYCNLISLKKYRGYDPKSSMTNNNRFYSCIIQLKIFQDIISSSC